MESRNNKNLKKEFILYDTPTPTPSSSCKYIECGGTMGYADCGMFAEPGYQYVMDCNLCKCLKIAITPTPTPTSTPLPCKYIECGGTTGYADCGMFSEPGYQYVMDCNLCKCVKMAITPTPTLNDNYKFNAEGLAILDPVDVYVPTGSINVSGGVTSRTNVGDGWYYEPGINKFFFYYKITLSAARSSVQLLLDGSSENYVRYYRNKSTFLIGDAELFARYNVNITSPGPIVVYGSAFPRFINVFVGGSSSFKVQYNF